MSPPESTCPKGFHAVDLMGEKPVRREEAGGGAAVYGADHDLGKLVGMGGSSRRSLRQHCGPGKVSTRPSAPSEPGTPIRGSPRWAGVDGPSSCRTPQGRVGGSLGEARPQIKATVGPQGPQGERTRSSAPTRQRPQWGGMSRTSAWPPSRWS